MVYIITYLKVKRTPIALVATISLYTISVLITLLIISKRAISR